MTLVTMKIQAMLDWSPDEKAAKAKEWAQSLFTLRLQKATGQLENPMKIKQLKKDIARLKTAQNMSAAAAAAAAAHQVAAHDATAEETEEKISANEKSARGTAKPKPHAAASGKGAKKRAAAAAKGAKKVAGAAAKAHAPSKKSSEPSGGRSAGPKAKSAPAASPKSKKK